MSHPSNITRAQTLRIVADLTDLAFNNGATIEPGISVYSGGYANITISAFRDGIPHRDVTAWQLASGTAWDVTSRTSTYRKTPQRSRSCEFTWQGITVVLCLLETGAVAE